MPADADQLVLDFLGQVADLAQGQMSPLNRAKLIDRLRLDIEKRARDRGVVKREDMRQILLGMGTAQALVTVEANKDPLFVARQKERLRSGFSGSASIFSPEVDPRIASMVTPGSLLNPSSDRYGGYGAGGDSLPGPELPLDPDPFGAGVGEWSTGESGSTLTLPVVPTSGGGGTGGAGGVAGGGPQVLQEGTGGAAYTPPKPVSAAPYTYGPVGTGPWMRRFSQSAAQNHTQAFISVAVLAIGAALNAVVHSPYAIAAVLLGYLIAMTSYSYSLGEKRFAMLGVPLTAVLFYALGLLIMRGRSTGHTSAQSTGTIQDAKDWLATVPTMIALLAALYLTWRLARSIAKAG